MFKSILIAVDGSDPSKDAIIAGCKLAAEQGATVHLVHAPMAYADVVAVGYSAATIPPSQEQIEKAGKEVLDGAKALAKENGVTDVISEIKYGYPANVLVDYAKNKGIDLIVMGRRGLGSITGLLVGSVTNKVQQLAPCAVLTVK